MKWFFLFPVENSILGNMIHGRKKSIFCFVFAVLGLLFFSNFCFAENVIAEDVLPVDEKPVTGKGKVNIELYGAGDLDSGEITEGFKLQSPFFDTRFYGSGEKSTFGFSLFSDNFFKILPVSVKFGKIVTGGSLSKLNSPLLSASASPFSNAVTETSYLSCNLPGGSAYSKPFGSYAFLGFSYGKKVKVNLKNAFYYDIENKDEYAFNFYGKFDFFRKVKVSYSYTGGMFPYEENDSSSWFTDSKYYAQGNHFCNLLQTGISAFNCSSLFSVGIYENPFGKFDCIYKAENKFKTKNFIFNLSFLFNDNDGLISSSDKKIDDCFQLKLGSQYLFTLKLGVPVFMKIGGALYGKFYLTENEHDVKFGFGVQGNCLFDSFSIVFLGEGGVKTDSSGTAGMFFKTGSVQLKNSIYFPVLTLSVDGKFSFSPVISKDNDSDDELLNDDFVKNNSVYYYGLDSSQKFSLGVSFSEIPYISNSNSVTFWQKNGEFNKASFSSSLNGTFYLKTGAESVLGIRILVKLSFAKNWNAKNN